MKKTNFVTLLIVFLFFLFIPEGKLYPQVKSYSSKFKPPIVTVELLFSYPHPLPDLSGKLGEFFTFQKFGVQNGIIGSQINVQLSTDKKGRIRPYMSLGYSLFYGSDKNTAFIDTNYVNGYPPAGSTLYNSTPGSSELYLHSFLAGAGFEYAFMNRTKWTPHLEAEFDMNILFGTYRQTPTTSKGAPGEVSFTIREAVRFGFGVGGGVQLRLTRAFGLGFTTKYKFANLLGKNSERFAEVNKLSLNDKSAPDLNKYLNKDRNIQYVEFMLGMVFFIERK